MNSFTASNSSGFSALRRVLVGTVMVLGLSGCNTIGDFLGINPPPGAINLTLTGPKKGTQVSVTISGGDAGPQTFTDDGSSFTKVVSLRPGSYPVTASPLAGYVALISVRQSSGNTTQQGTYSVPVESSSTTSVQVSYQAQTP
jgi:hypothetical protein